MTWEHSVAGFNACTGLGGAHVSPVSTPLPLWCKRKWSCHQSFLLLHSVMSCCTSLYFKFSLRKNYTDRQTRRVLVLLKNVKKGFCCMLVWNPRRITHMVCKVSLLHFKEKWIFLHMSSMSCKCKKENHSYLLWNIKYVSIYTYTHTYIHTYI